MLGTLAGRHMRTVAWRLEIASLVPFNIRTLFEIFDMWHLEPLLKSGLKDVVRERAFGIIVEQRL